MVSGLRCRGIYDFSLLACILFNMTVSLQFHLGISEDALGNDREETRSWLSTAL